MLPCMIIPPLALKDIPEDVDWRKEIIEVYAARDEALRQIEENRATIKVIEKDIRDYRAVADENPENQDFQEIAFDRIQGCYAFIKKIHDRQAVLEGSIKIFDAFIATFQPLVRKDVPHR